MRIGKVSDSVLRRSVLKLSQDTSENNITITKGAASVSDCALSVDEDGSLVAGSVSTFTAPFAHGGYLAVHNAANNLYTCGIDPAMIILNVMLSPDTEEAALKEIMRDCRMAADELGIPIRGGHTEVTDALTRNLISATAMGRAPHGIAMPAVINAGDSIIMTGFVATEGTALLADKFFEKLSGRFPKSLIEDAKDFLEHASVRDAARIAHSSGAKTAHDISGGGVFAALWELSVMMRRGFIVDLKAIPIRQETVEITNFLGLNPYQMLSGGALLFVTDRQEQALAALADAGINAAVIGTVSDNNDKVILNDDEKRYLDKPAADEILKGNVIQ